jgi:hypothetical protein
MNNTWLWTLFAIWIAIVMLAFSSYGGDDRAYEDWLDGYIGDARAPGG